jgi:hypothetical protein
VVWLGILQVGDAWQHMATAMKLPTFRVLSRLDLKIATGGFKEEERLGMGPRCVARSLLRAFASARI